MVLSLSGMFWMDCLGHALWKPVLEGVSLLFCVWLGGLDTC